MPYPPFDIPQDPQYGIPSIISAYAEGNFLMAGEDGELEWYTSSHRTLIPLDDRFRYPTSLRRVLNQHRFRVAINRNFRAVVEGCADRDETWISPELKEIYWQLHRAGWAHSFETWQGDELAGGILGIAIAGAFIGESMFYRIPEGSKVAMVKLVEQLRSHRFVLFDAQMMNPHLERFGAYTVGDREYQRLLQQALTRDCSLDRSLDNSLDSSLGKPDLNSASAVKAGPPGSPTENCPAP